MSEFLVGVIASCVTILITTCVNAYLTRVSRLDDAVASLCGAATAEWVPLVAAAQRGDLLRFKSADPHPYVGALESARAYAIRLGRVKLPLSRVRQARTLTKVLEHLDSRVGSGLLSFSFATSTEDLARIAAPFRASALVANSWTARDKIKDPMADVEASIDSAYNETLRRMQSR